MGVRNSLVRIRDSEVDKYTSDPVRTAEKYAAVHLVAQAHGFVAPRVRDTRADHVVLERIRNIISLRDLYLGSDLDVLDAAVSRAGEALAGLHRNLPRPGGSVWSPAPRFLADLRRYASREIDVSSLEQTTPHGDYSFANVFVIGSDPDRIAVIDPCPNFGSTFDEWAPVPIYVDIGKMLSCLEGQVPARRLHRRPSHARISDLQERFLASYERSGAKLDREVANAFAFAVASAQFHRRFGRLGRLHQSFLYNRFRGNFPGARKTTSSLGVQVD